MKWLVEFFHSHWVQNEDTQSFVGGSIIGIIMYIGVDPMLAQKLLNFFVGATSAIVFGFLSMAGKDGYPFAKQWFIRKWKNRKRGK